MNERENTERESRAGAPARNGVQGGLRRGASRRRPKFCYYCVEKQEHVDYKDVENSGSTSVREGK